VDVAAAGGDAFRELGDDANGVLRGVEGGGQSVVGIKRSRHAENKQAERERGRERYATHGALEEMDAEEVARGDGGGERPARQR
jgi:hypothetical protein